MKTQILFLFLFTGNCFTGCKKEEIKYTYTGETFLDHSTDIVLALQSIEQSSNHLWQRAGWWNSANVLEALLDYHRLTGVSYAAKCKKIFNSNQYWGRGGFKNRSYDDNAWWALAWLKAYDLYGETRYLETAEDVFDDMVKGGWDNTCGGGMAWQSDERYKNAITNELFIVLAAKLAQRQNNEWRKRYYLDWSLRGWQWLNQSGICNSQHLYNDGLDKNCENNHETTWTYNQGVILGGLKELYLLTGDQTYLQHARQTALACMHIMSDADSILTEPCRNNCGEDGVQFKSIFIRYLSELNLELKDPQIKSYIIHNAGVAWANAQNEKHLFDVKWQGPFNDWHGSTTGVALDLVNAATVQARQ